MIFHWRFFCKYFVKKDLTLEKLNVIINELPQNEMKLKKYEKRFDKFIKKR